MTSEAPRIQVVHATAPGCQWSWGYEAVFNRLRMVYGDAIDVHVRLGAPYEDWRQWLVDYGMTEPEACAWVNDEVAPIMGVALARAEPGKVAPTVLPASLAVLAARRVAPERAERFQRALLRMFAVEGADPSRPATIAAAAREAGVDAGRLEREMQDEASLREELEAEGSRGPPLHAGFYNVVVWDGGNRRVILDYAFDPEVVEGAIDYLSGGTLRKARPTDVVGYLREHGVAPLSEVGRVFGMDADEAMAALERLEKEGRLERVTLAGAPHWRATGG